MSLSHFAASPVIVEIQAEPYLIRPLTLGDYGTILANAPKRDDGSEPGFGDPSTAEWMFGVGLSYLLYAVIRRDRPAFTLGDAVGLSVFIQPETAREIYSAAMRRLPATTPAEGTGVDVNEVRWGPVFKRMATEYHFTPETVASLTLDQIYALCISADDLDRPETLGTPLTKDEVMSRFVCVDGVWCDVNQVPDKPAIPDEVTLADLGLEIVPEAEERTILPMNGASE